MVSWALLLAAPCPAHAQPTAADKETARSLMDDGDRAYANKDYRAALKAYEAAHALVVLPSTGIWVVKSRMALGQLVEARDMALQVLALPKRKTTEHPASTRARAEAADLAAQLASRIPSVQVAVEGIPEGAPHTVTIDGSPLTEPTARAPRKVDPGEHTITVSAPAYRAASMVVSVPEAETVPVYHRRR